MKQLVDHVDFEFISMTTADEMTGRLGEESLSELLEEITERYLFGLQRGSVEDLFNCLTSIVAVIHATCSILERS